MGGKTISVYRVENDYWYHSCIQKWALKCYWGCWRNSSHLSSWYSICQESDCTNVPSSSAVVQSFLSARFGMFGPWRLHPTLRKCRGLPVVLPETTLQIRVLKAVLNWWRSVWSSDGPHNNFWLASQLDGTRLLFHGQKKLNPSLCTTQ